MGDKTSIEWTRGDDGSPGATWNPVTGCDKVSPGCENCYAMTLAPRLKAMGSANYQRDGDPRTSGPGFGLTCHPHMLDVPLRWRRPRRIFVNSMSDLFHPDVPDGFIGDVFNVMAIAEHHTFQVLTKRPQRMADLLAKWEADDWTWRRSDQVWCGPIKGPLRNVWLGTSIESDRYTFRADHLRRTPAAVRFLSCEPLLGPLPSLDLAGVDWVIVGGESGPGARPMHPRWVREIEEKCHDQRVENVDARHGYTFEFSASPEAHRAEYDDDNERPAFFFKQFGNWAPIAPVEFGRSGDMLVHVDGRTFTDQPADSVEDRRQMYAMRNVGKKAAGRLLDGRTHDGFPAVVTPEEDR